MCRLEGFSKVGRNTSASLCGVNVVVVVVHLMLLKDEGVVVLLDGCALMEVKYSLLMWMSEQQGLGILILLFREKKNVSD